MARKTWSGAIEFAGFPLNFAFFPRANTSNPSFKMLSPHNEGPLRRQYVDSEGNIIPETESLKGLEVGKDTYKVVPAEAIEVIKSGERTSTIEPLKFPQLDTVDLTLSSGAYAVVPDPKVPGSDAGAKLIWNGLRAAEQAMVASVVFKSGMKDQIVVVHAGESGLLANTLHYAANLHTDLPLWEPEVDEDAADLFAVALERKGYDVSDFVHSEFVSGYEGRREEAIAKALKGEKIEAPEAAEAQAAAPDLMAALAASVGEAKRQSKPKKAKAKAKVPA